MITHPARLGPTITIRNLETGEAHTLDTEQTVERLKVDGEIARIAARPMTGPDLELVKSD